MDFVWSGFFSLNGVASNDYGNVIIVVYDNDFQQNSTFIPA